MLEETIEDKGAHVTILWDSQRWKRALGEEFNQKIPSVYNGKVICLKIP